MVVFHQNRNTVKDKFLVGYFYLLNHIETCWT